MLKLFSTAHLKDIRLPIIAFGGSVALLALASAAPVAAQGVPAGLLRLDPPYGYGPYGYNAYAQDSYAYGREFVEVVPSQRIARPHSKTRSAFARDRRPIKDY
jgi:hypothetical protein